MIALISVNRENTVRAIGAYLGAADESMRQELAAHIKKNKIGKVEAKKLSLKPNKIYVEFQLIQAAAQHTYSDELLLSPEQVLELAKTGVPL